MSPRSTTAFYPLEGKKLDCWRSSSWDLTNIACDWWVRGWIPLWAPLARSIKPGHLTLRRALGGGGGSMCSQREQSCSWAQWVQGCRVSRLVEGVLWCQVVCVGSTGGPSPRVASMWVGVLERWRCQGTRAWGGTPKSRHAWADSSHGIWGLTFFWGLTAGFWILTYWYRLISEMQEFSISNWCTLIIWCPAVGWSQNHQKHLLYDSSFLSRCILGIEKSEKASYLSKSVFFYNHNRCWSRSHHTHFVSARISSTGPTGSDFTHPNAAFLYALWKSTLTGCVLFFCWIGLWYFSHSPGSSLLRARRGASPQNVCITQKRTDGKMEAKVELSRENVGRTPRHTVFWHGCAAACQKREIH